MDHWEVRRRGRVKVYGAERIRRKLAQGRLFGHLPCRPLGEDEWRPLREVADLNRPPAMPGGCGPRAQGRWGVLQGLLWHGAVYVGVVSFTGIPRVAAMMWGFGLLMHFASNVPKLFARQPAGAGTAAQPSGTRAADAEPAPASAPPPSPAPSPERDPFLAELAAAIADLERIATSRQLAGVDLAALRASAEDLRRRHLQLAGLAEPQVLARLAEERDRALAQAAAATDPRTVEALQQQARSVGERLASLAQAGEAAARLEARERTLLHQVESLRLELARSTADEALPTDLAGEVKRLQADVQATAEVEAHLARARLGARAGQRT